MSELVTFLIGFIARSPTEVLIPRADFITLARIEPNFPAAAACDAPAVKIAIPTCSAMYPDA